MVTKMSEKVLSIIDDFLQEMEEASKFCSKLH